MLIRAFKSADVDAVASVYRDAVITLGSQAYNAEQVKVWATYPDDREKFAAQLLKGLTLVCEENGTVAAFGQLAPFDHIALLYCSSPFSRRGFATAILQRLEDHARIQKIEKLCTEASRIAQPLFARQGFTVIEVERSIRLGVEFERFKMQKLLPTNHGD
ncbi:MAG TPA: GNAT family N-acetyltransferase [Opitutaceae bacterium]|nr:GNAT family N-acetyltransferase [Opitutaceae bacterium]